MMRLDRISDLFPGPRVPDGQDANIRIKAENQILLADNLAVEVGNAAGYQAMHEPALDQKHRDGIAALYRPEWDTRIFQVVYGETVPVSWTPYIGMGWIVSAITLFPGVLATFAAPANNVLHVNGFDEVSDMYLPFGTDVKNFALKLRCYGTQQINMTMLGVAGGALLSQPMVAFELENWQAGPLGS